MAKIELDIKQAYCTENPCYKLVQPLAVRGLMLHSVGCPQPDAIVFIRQFNRPDFKRACVHAFIDANTGDIYQTLLGDARLARRRHRQRLSYRRRDVRAAEHPLPGRRMRLRLRRPESRRQNMSPAPIVPPSGSSPGSACRCAEPTGDISICAEREIIM